MQQEELVNKIIRYLRNELNHITDPRERENRHAIIDYFVKCGGICHGLSTLWVYGKKLSDEAQLSPNPSNDSAKDDISFFNHVQNLLKSWDGFTPFYPIQKRDIEGFISHVLLYQRFDLMDAWTSNKNNSKLLNNFTQKDINAVLEDTKRGRAISSFTQNEVPLTKLMLADRLSKLIKPHSLAIISLIGDESGHAMSFYQNASDKKIFFYDSNAEEEVVVNDEKELVDCFWKNINPSHLRESASNSALSDSVLRNTRINIFRFASDPVYNYSVDKADQIQDEEFVSLFENAPEFLAAVRVDKQFQRLVDALNPKQVVRLLQNQNIHPELKHIIVLRCVLTMHHQPPLIARYLTEHCQVILADLKSKQDLTDADLESLSYFANKPISAKPTIVSVHSPNYIKARAETIKQWLELHDQGFIQKNDVAELNMADVIYLLKERTPSMALVKDLMLYCNIEIVKEIGTVILMFLKMDDITAAKQVLTTLADDFQIFPSLETIFKYNNLEIAKFMHLNYGHHPSYNTAFGTHSYFPQLLKDIHVEMQFSTQLKRAIEQGDEKKLQNLIKDPQFNPQQLFEDGFTLAHIAAYNGSASMIPLLAAHGVDLNQKSTQGVSPIAAAICSYPAKSDRYKSLDQIKLDHLNTAKAFLEAGVDIHNALSEFQIQAGRTLVSVAVDADMGTMIPLLAKQGINVNQVENDGAPPLWCAARQAAPPLASIASKDSSFNALIAAGADIEATINYARSNRNSYYYQNAINLLEIRLAEKLASRPANPMTPSVIASPTTTSSLLQRGMVGTTTSSVTPTNKTVLKTSHTSPIQEKIKAFENRIAQDKKESLPSRRPK